MRIRSLRPEFWKGRRVRSLTPFARLLLLGLNNFCDDEGRAEWDEPIIKAQIFPTDRLNIGKLLNELVETGSIVKYGKSGHTYLCIPDWDQLQSPKNPYKSKLPSPMDEGVTVSPLMEKRGRSARPLLMDTLMDTLMDRKGQLSALFEKFWKAYPRKRSKGDAEKSFYKINPSTELVDIMIGKHKEATQTKDWQKEGGQYIPYPATWLNRKGWEDDYAYCGMTDLQRRIQQSKGTL